MWQVPTRRELRGCHPALRAGTARALIGLLAPAYGENMPDASSFFPRRSFLRLIVHPAQFSSSATEPSCAVSTPITWSVFKLIRFLRQLSVSSVILESSHDIPCHCRTFLPRRSRTSPCRYTPSLGYGQRYVHHDEQCRNGKGEKEKGEKGMERNGGNTNTEIEDERD